MRFLYGLTTGGIVSGAILGWILASDPAPEPHPDLSFGSDLVKRNFYLEVRNGKLEREAATQDAKIHFLRVQGETWRRLLSPTPGRGEPLPGDAFPGELPGDRIPPQSLPIPRRPGRPEKGESP